ncbi:helix-turn-helix domain-containing protein [Pontibacter indicus]|uniref:DNA-binding transcriptional regulator, XRE-family HTH domain n=1 Tax=Pontibacter indicus TaxID=1317125 RepID=A0A1R3XQ88_9BACT|nr:helix-turn-helix transcriptional regulator [Pontibacter indicus]SIT94048.1 DNA-binding transcriptional regulator, XRE-family HTH domain [Pontibacter indicus]
METAARKKPIHLGDHVRRMRTALGVKQSALAIELGMTQQNVSRIEQEEEVDDVTLEKIGKVLGVSAEAIKNFDEDAAINIVSTTFNSHDNSTSVAFKSTFNFNPIDKLMEVMDENKKLYERLLQSEREKVEFLERLLKDQQGR